MKYIGGRAYCEICHGKVNVKILVVKTTDHQVLGLPVTAPDRKRKEKVLKRTEHNHAKIIPVISKRSCHAKSSHVMSCHVMS